ncbi:2Fe-2S iron-sulfur cluster-binding protein [Kitasatospora sp. HPMI-4]|uniref:(2Fe-2S)-binding protein n=1 Tax=Kitasatospora sp. HPMI-4 TaxID=3448443 RepID=UPI003F1CD0B2
MTTTDPIDSGSVGSDAAGAGAAVPDPLGTDLLSADPLGTDPLGPGPVEFGGNGRPCASYTLRVNGFERPVTDAWIGESLLYVLRERLGLAGAKDGCEQGECGACSVLVDGQLVAGCLVPAALASDSEIATVEGLSAGGVASDVQQALADSGAVQCGYCTPGLAMAVHDLLQRNHRPSEIEARQALCGNLCRCTGYRGVLAAVQAVAEARGAEEELTEDEAAAAAEAPAAVAEPDPATTAPPAEPVPATVQDTGTAQPVPTQPMPAQPESAQPAADLPAQTGELPVYADSEAWIEAPYPVEPTTAGTGIGIDYGTAGAHQTGVYEPYPGYTATPPHGTPYDPGYEASGYETPGYEAQSSYAGPYDAAYDTSYGQSHFEAAPVHGAAVDGPLYESTPAHGTPYVPAPAHGNPFAEAAPVYEGHDGSTPVHGIPFVEGAPVYEGYDGTVHGIPFAEAAPVYEGHDGSTPAHGIREDDHA